MLCSKLCHGGIGAIYKMALNNPSNFTSIVSVMEYANYTMQGYLGVMILVAVAIIVFLIRDGFVKERAASSMFVILILSIIMRFLDLINTDILTIVIALFIISAVILFTGRDSRA